MRLLGDELAWPLFIYGDHLPQGNCTYFFIFSSPFWQPPFFFCKNVISTPVFIYLHLAALQKCQMGPLVLQPLAKQGSGPQTLPYLSKDGWFGDFPDGLVVKTLCFCCRGCGFDPWSDNWGPACCVVQPKKKNCWFGHSRATAVSGGFAPMPGLCRSTCSLLAAPLHEDHFAVLLTLSSWIVFLSCH